MKYILFLLLLVPYMISAQDCKLKKETDPFTHITRITTGFVPFVSSNGTRFSLSVDATPSDVDFFILFSNDSKCFDETSTAVVNYEGDRLKANFKNSGSMNCQGAFHISFRNVISTPTALERISLKRMNTIRLTGNNNVITEIILNEEGKKVLMAMSACIIKESKSLIKQ